VWAILHLRALALVLAVAREEKGPLDGVEGLRVLVLLVLLLLGPGVTVLSSSHSAARQNVSSSKGDGVTQGRVNGRLENCTTPRTRQLERSPVAQTNMSTFSCTVLLPPSSRLIPTATPTSAPAHKAAARRITMAAQAWSWWRNDGMGESK
jgi:hypothetical protein